jgi:restriction system protein
METPRYYECMNPILTALREGGGTLTNDEIVDAVANIMHLPDDVMNRKQQGHNMGEVAYRIAWAKSYLKKAGYLTQSSRGVWALTAEGKATDAVDVRAILTDVRKDYVTRRTEKELPPTVLGDSVEGASAAIAEVEEELGWKQQVLDALLAMSPDAFERLSQRLLRECGLRKWRSPGARAMGVSTAKGSCGLGA